MSRAGVEVEEYHAGELVLLEEDLRDISVDYVEKIVTVNVIGPLRLVAYLAHPRGGRRIGGRNELLQLREDIDKALEQIP